MSTNGKVIELNGAAGKVEPETYRLVQITTLESLIEVWPYVVKGMERIRARDKSCGSWTNAQVYNAIRFGLPTAPQKTTAVELHCAVDASGCLHGFMVTTPKLDPFRNNVPYGLIVWLLYGNYRLIELLFPSLEMICRVNGYEMIEFQSGRQGWMRHFGRMARLGFEIVQQTYRKAIQY